MATQQTNRKPFKQRAIDTVAALGLYLVNHCEEIVGNIDNINKIEISMEISGGEMPVEFPLVKVTHSYADKQIVNAFIGAELGK